jgi:hypothetical protein
MWIYRGLLLHVFIYIWISRGLLLQVFTYIWISRGIYYVFTYIWISRCLLLHAFTYIWISRGLLLHVFTYVVIHLEVTVVFWFVCIFVFVSEMSIIPSSYLCYKGIWCCVSGLWKVLENMPGTMNSRNKLLTSSISHQRQDMRVLTVNVRRIVHTRAKRSTTIAHGWVCASPSYTEQSCGWVCVCVLPQCALKGGTFSR